VLVDITPLTAQQCKELFATMGFLDDSHKARLSRRVLREGLGLIGLRDYASSKDLNVFLFKGMDPRTIYHVKKRIENMSEPAVLCC
jgi:hypothetical protein